MTVIQVTRERTNAFRLLQHGLWPKRMDLMEALGGTGFLPTREAAYLSVAARVEGFHREDLDRVVFEERALVEMGTVGGQSFLVPLDIAPALLRCPSSDERATAEMTLARAWISMANRAQLKEAVLDALGPSGLGFRELKERLTDDASDVAEWTRKPGVLQTTLTLLRHDGEMVRTVLEPPLDEGEVVFAKTETLLPGIEVMSIEPEDALRKLCAWYFRVHGPASHADFGRWCGAGIAEAAAAFAATLPSLAPVRIEGVPHNLFMAPTVLEQLMEFESLLPDPVHLVPWRDSWLTTHEGRAGRFGRREAIHRLGPGPALPALLVSGEVKGRWSITVETGEVDLDWFFPAPPKVRQRAKAVASELSAFVRREMPNIEPLVLPCPKGEFGIYR